MSAELREFNNLIEDLKSVVSQPDFDSKFKSKAKNVPKAKQFLIKMELKRLAQPCNRLLDLRGNVAGEPVEYEHKGQIHYLDEVAKSIFEDQLKKFGRYTIGGYEAVLNAENNNRVLHKKEQQQRIAEKNDQQQSANDESIIVQTPEPDYAGELIHFTQYGIRAEERMNFSIAVELQFAIGDVLKAVSSDLSVSGIKVKIPAIKKVAIGQRIAIYLTGLEQEFELGLKDGIQYEVVGIDEINANQNYVRMKRTFDEDIAAFDEFLGNFINGNKRRYKVNLDNTLEAVSIKGYEQYYLPRVTTLPIYLRQVKTHLLPTLTLATENNRSTLGYFSDENKNLIFQQILNPTRLELLLSSEKTIKETTLYCFTHAKAGRLFYYSAITEELTQNEAIKSTFLSFGSTKESWRAFKLQLVPASEHDAHIPLSVPDSANTEIKKQNQPPSPKVVGLLNNLKYIAYLTPLNKPEEAKKYQQHYNVDQPLSMLKQFGHAKLKSYMSIEVETIDYVNLRSEERYLYKSPVSVAIPDSEETISGSTRDFSPHGLQIVLSEPSQFLKGDIIVLGLPELQKVTNKYKLRKLPYEVVAISRDKTIMNLRVYEPRGFHHGRQFFKKLISQNRTKLTPAKMESRFPGLSLALRNIFARHVCNMPIYFSREGSKLDISVVGSSGEKNVFIELLKQHQPDGHDITLYPILKDNVTASMYGPMLEEMERTDTPKTVELYVRFRKNQASVKRTFICHYGNQFLSEDMLNSFVQASCKNDVFFAFRLYLSRTGRPDMDYIARELSYIGNYAQHRAKALESKLWNITGIGDIIDISEEVMIRMGCDSSILQNQISLKNSILG